MTRHRLIAVPALVVLLVAALAGPLAGPVGSASTTRAGACAEATVSLGRSPGAIGFRVECKVAKGREASFQVSRINGAGRKVGIKGFRRGLTVGEDGSGSCRRFARTVSCTVRGTGSVVARGRVTVRPGVRCAKRVSVTSFASEPCPEDEACASSGSVVSLYRARPRGC